MKIAIASGGSPDYLIDIVADGLIRLTGRNHVHLEYNRWDPAHSCYSQLMAGFGPDRLRTEDCGALVASTRVPVATIRDFKKRVGGPVIVLDGEDWPDLSPEHLTIASVYFKREYLRGSSHPAKIRPLAFGVIPEKVERHTFQNRDVPLIFSAGDSAGIRSAVRARVEAMSGAIGGGMSHDTYMGWLARSKIGVSARGAGWDTYRYWETPWAGAMLLSQRLDIVIEDDFVEGQEALFFDDVGQMEMIARSLLAETWRCADIGTRGLHAVEERHLSTHRAARVIDAIERTRV